MTLLRRKSATTTAIIADDAVRQRRPSRWKKNAFVAIEKSSWWIARFLPLLFPRESRVDSAAIWPKPTSRLIHLEKKKISPCCCYFRFLASMNLARDAKVKLYRRFLIAVLINILKDVFQRLLKVLSELDKKPWNLIHSKCFVHRTFHLVQRESSWFDSNLTKANLTTQSSLKKIISSCCCYFHFLASMNFVTDGKAQF